MRSRTSSWRRFNPEKTRRGRTGAQLQRLVPLLPACHALQCARDGSNRPLRLPRLPALAAALWPPLARLRPRPTACCPLPSRVPQPSISCQVSSSAVPAGPAAVQQLPTSAQPPQALLPELQPAAAERHPSRCSAGSSQHHPRDWVVSAVCSRRPVERGKGDAWWSTGFSFREVLFCSHCCPFKYEPSCDPAPQAPPAPGACAHDCCHRSRRRRQAGCPSLTSCCQVGLTRPQQHQWVDCPSYIWVQYGKEFCMQLSGVIDAAMLSKVHDMSSQHLITPPFQLPYLPNLFASLHQ